MPAIAPIQADSLLDSLPVTIFRVNRGYRIDYVNAYGAAQYGRTPEEILGRNCSELGMPKDFFDLWHAELDKVFAGNATGEFEYFRTYTNPARLIEFQLAPERDAHGQVERVLVVMLHIDKVHRLRRAVEAQEEMFRHFMEHNPAIAWLRDSQSRYRFVNRTYESRYGIKSIDLIGRRPNEVWPPEIAEEFLRHEALVRSSGIPQQIAVVVPDRDGQPRDWLTVNFPITDEYGQQLVGGFGVDVTEEKQSAAKLAQAQKLESLGLFAAGAAHDFNNLLSAVIGHAGLARIQSQNNPDLADSFRAIESAGEQMAELCQQLLSFAGRAERQLRDVNLNAIVQDTLSLVRTLVPRTVAVRLELAGELPLLHADETQLRQVVMNLVLNAAEALTDQPGTITVRTALAPPDTPPREPVTASEGSVVLSVHDDGPGMAPDVRARVFEPFFSTKPKGRGLGLSAVDGIVRSHQGFIIVDSNTPRGTSFKVHLPTSALGVGS